MRGGRGLTFFLLTICIGCTKFEDASMTERNTFVHFFNSQVNYEGVVAVPDADGGYIISGTIRHDNKEPDALIIKTDARGHKLWEQVISKSTVNDIKPYGNGYILVGDSVQYNTGSTGSGLHELENTYARLLLMNAQGAIVDKHTSTGTVRVGEDTLTIDYHGNAFDFTPNNEVVVLGNYRIPGSRQAAFVSIFNLANISSPTQSIHSQPFEFDRDLINCNAVHFVQSKVVWASTVRSQEGSLQQDFTGISDVPRESVYQNFVPFGNSDTRNYSASDIRRSPVGYCVVGTYSETNGSNGNIYFLHLSPQLTPLLERYIDGEELMITNTVLDPTSRTSSRSLDEGLAVVSTSDGFVIAGTMTTTPAVGNGGKDLLLVKLDAEGNLIWKRLIGGGGDETVSSIRETADNGLLICGSNIVNGHSTIMLMKTDRNGNLDN
jgi:hypothetical protein